VNFAPLTERCGRWLAVLLCALWMAPALAQEAPPAAENAPAPEIVEDVVTPKILSDGDIALYKEIFALQEDGHWKKADRKIAKLKDRTLMGHVLYQRYMHPTKYRSKFEELRDWMAEYADVPNADKIYRLAMRRKPAKSRAPAEPVPERYEAPEEAKPVTPPQTAEERDRKRREYALRSGISKNLNKHPDVAEKYVWAASESGLMSDVEVDSQMSLVAKAYYFKGNIEKALALGSVAERRSGPEVPEASWFAGLAAWRLGRFDEAARHFEKVPEAPDAGNALSAAGAYWAARSYIKAHKPDQVIPALEKAATYPMTFYGILAARHLDMPYGYDWSPPRLTQRELDQAMTNPGVKRAIALAEVGQRSRADEEMYVAIRRQPPEADYEKMLKVAAHMDLTSSQIVLARRMMRDRNQAYQSALFPVPEWAPEDGFRVDRALLYAFMRQESNFMSWARSWAGAQGIMQLMPSTAAYIHHDSSLKGSGKHKLYDPSFNMMLGQKYIDYLMRKDTMKGNLLLVVCAYNAGPGNVAKWLALTNHGDDWLLFMESIPIFETRAYVEHVMANLWVYRARLGQPAPTLDQMAGGLWPRYASIDHQTASTGAAGQ